MGFVRRMYERSSEIKVSVNKLRVDSIAVLKSPFGIGHCVLTKLHEITWNGLSVAQCCLCDDALWQCVNFRSLSVELGEHLFIY